MAGASPHMVFSKSVVMLGLSALSISQLSRSILLLIKKQTLVWVDSV